MRQALFIILILASCNSKTTGFDDYLSQIDEIKKPITYHSSDYPGTSKYQQYKLDLFKKYSKTYSHELQGLVYKDKQFVGLIFNIIGDINSPFLMTYDKWGNKIDSLNIFPNAFESLNELRIDHTTIYPDKRIEIISETKTWDLTEDGEEIIEGTEKLSVDTVKITILDNGQIKKERL